MSLKTIRLNMFRLLAVLFIFNNKEIQRNFALGKFEGHVLCANTLDIIPPLYDWYDGKVLVNSQLLVKLCSKGLCVLGVAKLQRPWKKRRKGGGEQYLSMI